MPEFSYKFETKFGVKKGELDADSLEHAAAILKKMRIAPIGLKEKPKDLFGGQGPAPTLKNS